MSRQQKLELLQLLAERKRRERVYRYRQFYKTLYVWQRKFVRLTAEFHQVCLIAANRIGKTYTGTFLDSMHALGDYPEDWDGHKFEKAPLIWVLGYSGEKIRDLLQMPIVGSVSDGKCEGGLIPPDRIVDVIPAGGTPRLAKEVQVRHSSGGVSRIQFWSYSQGQHALMGDSVDWFHIDEEPRDPTIYPQVLTRTATGDGGKGGRGILTFTPENGRTDLVIQFMDTPGAAQVYINAGWDDAPHLSEKVKQDLLESFPAHQREMRTKGVPMLGHGRIYDFAEEYVTCEPFEIPAHWRVINGMDFGWDHPQGHVQLAIDPDTESIYVTRAWAQSRTVPEVAWGAVKIWAQNVPTAWPLDGLQTEKGSGKEQRKYYQDAGWKMLADYAMWPDGSNGVEAGVYEIRDLMSKGKFKVFRGLREWFDEFTQYHRDDRGNIVKIRDDLMSATRYAYMMRRFAVPFGDVGKPKKQIKPPRHGAVAHRPSGGYWM
jgi:phage terminase large subunit-like protein